MTQGSLEYITVRDAAQKWNMSPRRVQILCAQERIAGVVRFGNRLMIPADAVCPTHASDASAAEDLPLPRKTPFLYMTDLYSVPGKADEVARGLAYHYEAQVLFEAEVAYSRGEIDKVYQSANYLLQKHSGFYAVLSGGMLLALCAIWKGDLQMWRRAKMHIFEASAGSEIDRDIVSLTVTAADSMLYDVENFPDWFKIGNFEPLHPDALPAAKVFYARYLFATGYALATGQLKLEGVQGLSLMAMIPLTVEPMVSQARADHSIVSEICLRMICAMAYHNSGNDEQAIRHIERAIELALPDRLLGLLVEYSRALDTLLERCLFAVDEEACAVFKKLCKVYNEGWTRLSNSVRGKQLINTLSPKEREVAKLAAFGMSNPEIAKKLNMSLSIVKQSIRIASEKSGMPRDQFAMIL